MAVAHASEPTTDWDTLPLVLTLEQVAEVLHVSRTSAYEAHRRGQIPGAFKIGRRLRFSREAVRRAVEGIGGTTAKTEPSLR
jgi:excisionase family DNA binding protein